MTLSIAIQNYIARDPFLLKEAKGIAFTKYWYDLQGNEEIIFGTYRTSQRAYETAIDLRFEQLGCRCNCKSKSNPCKHGIALVLLMLECNDYFIVTSELPAQYTDWLNRRTRRQIPKERSLEEEQQRQAEREKIGKIGFNKWQKD
ncbi:MAG: hypothetical protein HC912_08805 [Saprospiraceae bacterium]|nr:hypothetical protein [Saprospiraceae bacterium]